MTAELVTLASTLQESTVYKHVDDPYSDEALSEPSKSCVDLGYVDLESCARAGHCGAVLKGSRKNGSFADDEPPALVHAYNLFLNAALEILGTKRYFQSHAYYDYRLSDVPAGETQLPALPHLDAYQSSITMTEKLRILGIACNTLATEVFQGDTSREMLSESGEVSNPR